MKDRFLYYLYLILISWNWIPYDSIYIIHIDGQLSIVISVQHLI